MRGGLARVVQHGTHNLLASHIRHSSSPQELGPLSALEPYSPSLYWDNKAVAPDSEAISEVA